MSTWRQRFALSTYDNRWQEYFCASRCVEDRKTYLAVRVCLFLTVLAVFIWSVAHHPSRCYLIYLTNQMLIIEVVYLAFAAYTTASAFYRDAPSPTPWFAKATWVLQDLTLSASFLVFLLYWTLIYDGGTPRPITPFTHGYNFLAMAIDQLLTNQPVRPWHFVYFIGYAVLYLVWSVIFNFSGLRCDGERYIYEPLNWKKFDKTALTAAIILLVVCPLVYFSFAVCCGRRTRKIENDDLNRRASAMSIELVRRRSSINYDNLPVNRV